jgi:hypothetical protein
MSILDPTCGSGAFLFAALNILEPLYDACLEKMTSFLEDNHQDHQKMIQQFRQILNDVKFHHNQRYFILKKIMLNNLYGVDIMEEATEICKLRLFLKLVAQVTPNHSLPNYGIEPLPDIDFNIRAGNSLVGFANYDQVKKAVEGNVKRNLDFFSELYQSSYETSKNKEIIQDSLNSLNEELNKYLAREYGIDINNNGELEKWKKSHCPFHWFVEFYSIISRGGFDVIIGNPPYVEYSKIKKDYQIIDSDYKSEKSTNLFAYVTERSILLMTKQAKLGLIIPISFVCTQRMKYIQDIILNNLSYQSWHSIYAERPSKLFEGAEVLLSISIISAIFKPNTNNQTYTTGLRKWYSQSRQYLFNTTTFNLVNKRLNQYIIPKISDNLEISIISKIYNKSKNSLGSCFQQKTSYLIYYRIGGGRYWKIFTTFQPQFILNGVVSISSRENYLYFSTSQNRDIAVTIFSSTLFFWYFILTTNSRDMNPSDLKNFPLDIESISNINQKKLIDLCQKLMQDYQKNKQQKEKVSKQTGHIFYEEYYPRLSKPIIDEIDKILAEHYGFTEAELDFIINYDIKYRMGKELEDDD